MKKIDSFREKVVKRKKEALAKFNSAEKAFETKKKTVTADLKAAAKAWKEMNEVLEKRKAERKGWQK